MDDFPTRRDVLQGIVFISATSCFGFFGDAAEARNSFESGATDLRATGASDPQSFGFDLYSEFSGGMPTPHGVMRNSSVGVSSESWFSSSSSGHIVSDAVTLGVGLATLYAAWHVAPVLIAIYPPSAGPVAIIVIDSAFAVTSSSTNILAHLLASPGQASHIHDQMNWMNSWGLTAGVMYGFFDQEGADYAAKIGSSLHSIPTSVPDGPIETIEFLNKIYNLGSDYVFGSPRVNPNYMKTRGVRLLDRDLRDEIDGFSDHPILKTPSTTSGGQNFGGGGDPASSGYGGGYEGGGGIYNGGGTPFYWSDDSGYGSGGRGGGGGCSTCMLA